VVNVVLDPPVSWLNTSSGRASASVTRTWSTSRSISSAMIICVEVMIPWPLSERGSAKDTVPSRFTSIRIRFAVGRPASRSASSRS
jgi:hypothetical protein